MTLAFIAGYVFFPVMTFVALGLPGFLLPMALLYGVSYVTGLDYRSMVFADRF